MGKHVAIYCRVSSRAQRTESQEPDLKRWAEAQELPVKWYGDTYTGTVMERPGFSKLMRDIEAGKVAVVVVWRLDRLGRTAKGLAALFEDLNRRKVGLVSLKDGLDLSTPAGQLMANVLASVAAYETEVRAERVRAGQEVAKVKGVRFGRPVGTGKRIKVSPEQEATIRWLKGEGEKVARIARATGVSRQTVYSVLAG
jgi:DNA invertase Pin-like site-specific DNA recombinase